MKSKSLQIIIAFALGGFCLYLFARKVDDWAAVWQAMKGVHPGWAVVAILLSVNSILIRAIRWQSLLGRPFVSISTLFLASNIGFMGNGVFPARMGELIRPFLVWRATPHKFSTALATIVVERIYDLMGLLLILALVFMVFPFPSGTGMNVPDQPVLSAPQAGTATGMASAENSDPRIYIQELAKLGVIVFVVIFGALGTLSYAPAWSLKTAKMFFKPLPETISDKLLKAVAAFELGATSLRRPFAFLYCVFWTLVLWVSIAFSELVILWAMGITSVGMMGALFLMVGLCFAVMFPQAPGYIGVYQLMVQLILTKTFFVAQATATAAAWMMWLSQVPPVIFSGFISLMIMGVSFKEISHVHEEIPETSEEPAPNGNQPHGE